MCHYSSCTSATRSELLLLTELNILIRGSLLCYISVANDTSKNTKYRSYYNLAILVPETHYNVTVEDEWLDYTLTTFRHHSLGW